MDRKGEISPRFFWWLVLLVDMWKYSNRILKVPFCPVLSPLLLRVKCMCSKAQNYISYRSLPRFLTSKQRRTAITTFAIITTCYLIELILVKWSPWTNNDVLVHGELTSKWPNESKNSIKCELSRNTSISLCRMMHFSGAVEKKNSFDDVREEV